MPDEGIWYDDGCNGRCKGVIALGSRVRSICARLEAIAELYSVCDVCCVALVPNVFPSKTNEHNKHGTKIFIDR